MKKRLLITGATGFVGKTLLNRISKSNNFDIYSLVREKSGFPNEIILDLGSDSFKKAIDDFPDVDVVIHLGAKIGWDGSTKAQLFAPNVLATAELSKWAKRIGAYFIFASAAIVCGVNTPLIDSKSVPNPDTDYGYSKWLAEEAIRTSRVRQAILRIAGIFGKDGPDHLGLNKSIKEALNGNVPVLYGSGDIKRNYIYVEDVVNIILYCIDKGIEGTHLVAGSYTYTMLQMLEALCDILIPGTSPQHQKGQKGADQIIKHSSYLPKGRTFKSAVEDIAKASII